MSPTRFKWPADRMATQQGKGFGMYERAAALEAQGADVIHLEVGRPSFDTPLHIKQAAKDALDAGIVHYGDLRGSGELRAALAQKLADFNGITADPEEVLITNGLTQAAFATFMAALDPGDEVIVFEPYYPQHIPKVELIGGRIVSVPLVKDEGYRLDGEALDAAVTERTKAILVVNPANPVGRVFTREELEAVREIALGRDLLVITDEVYEFITYDGRRHMSIASLPGMWERTISLFAFTKAYAMDGWRLGYAAAPRRFIDDLARVTQNETTHPNVFAQEGAIEAVVGPQGVLDEMLGEDLHRRNLLCDHLDSLPGLKCPRPEGTIYAFPRIDDLGLPSEELAALLLERAQIAVEAGSFYGETGEGHLRICFGSEPEQRIKEALDRMTPVIQELAG